MEEKRIFASDIVFSGLEAIYLFETQKYFNNLEHRSAPKYKTIVSCAYIGLKLSKKERRATSEVEEYYEKRESEYISRTFNVPRSVLYNHEHELKTLLFLISTVEMKDELDANELQKVWNSPQFNRTGEGYGGNFYEYILLGAKYLLLLFEIRNLNADQINTEVFNILSRDCEKITLKEVTNPQESRLELDIDALKDVELE